ncbi:MAG: hypothetical protein IJ644_06025, partial [Oscillospiraceae bacterium]|nr:hypothetical protein [Oscillospiraceae bacterium]
MAFRFLFYNIKVSPCWIRKRKINHIPDKKISPNHSARNYDSFQGKRIVPAGWENKSIRYF